MTGSSRLLISIPPRLVNLPSLMATVALHAVKPARAQTSSAARATSTTTMWRLTTHWLNLVEVLPLRIPPAPPNPYDDNRKNSEYHPHERRRPGWCAHRHRQQRSDGRCAEQQEPAPPSPRAAA